MLLLSNATFAYREIVDRDSTAIRKRTNYFFTFGMGSIIGCNQCKITGKVASLSASTVHGVRVGKRLSLGAGIGFDSYENWKTLPLFGAAAWDLFGNKNKVFLQFRYGYAYAWINNQAKEYGYKSDQGGKMISSSLGYKISYGDIRLSFSVGYKFQRVFSNYEVFNWNACPYCAFASLAPQKKEVRTDMNRFVFDMTIGWK